MLNIGFRDGVIDLKQMYIEKNALTNILSPYSLLNKMRF